MIGDSFLDTDLVVYCLVASTPIAVPLVLAWLCTNDQPKLMPVSVRATSDSGYDTRIAIQYGCTPEKAFKVHQRFVDVFRRHPGTTMTTSATISIPTELFKASTLDVKFSDAISDALDMHASEVNSGVYIYKMAHPDATVDGDNRALDEQLGDMAGKTYSVRYITSRWGDDMFLSRVDKPHKCSEKED